MVDEILDWGAASLAERIRSGDVSAVRAVDAYVARIEAVEPRLHALAVERFDAARREAAAADERRNRGEALGPLHGVPITIKEEFLLAGTPTTFGVTGQASHRATQEGPLVRSLRRAGAIVLGKTNVSQLLIFLEADNPLYGRTNNPWDLSRTPGGSSGGEAALLAARGSALGLGADLGGSIRVPAHFCGVHGIRPTARRISDRDRRQDLVAPVQTELVPQPGLLARRVEDLRLGFAALSTSAGELEDPDVPPLTWRGPPPGPVSPLRVGFFTDDGFFPASPAIRRVVEEAAGALAERGAQVEPWSPPDPSRSVELLFGLVSADGGAAYRRALGEDRPMPQIAGLLRLAALPAPARAVVARAARTAGQGRLAWVIERIGRRSAAAYWKLAEARRDYRRQFLGWMAARELDLILCPPAALPALPHGATADLPGFASYAMLFNVVDLPAGVVAAGRVRPGEESDRRTGRDRVERAAAAAEEGSAGLPVGVQVVGRPWQEERVIEIMAVLEEHFRASEEYPELPSL